MEFNLIDLLYCVNAIVNIKCMLDLFHRITEETAIYSLYKKVFFYFIITHKTLLEVLLVQIE